MEAYNDAATASRVKSAIESPTAPSPPARRGWLTFSLRGLLLFSLFVALIVSHVNTSYRAKQDRVEHQAIETSLKQEIDALRQELGYFRVRDPQQVHILRLTQIESGHYAWRIYLPKDTKWKLKLVATHQQQEGGSSSSSSSSGVEAGEFVLHTKIYRAEDGNWRVGMMLPNRSSTLYLQPKTAFAGSSTSTSMAGLGSTLDLRGVDKVLTLLHVQCESPAQRDSTDPKVTDTIELLLEPETAAPPAPSETTKPAVE